MSNEENSNQDDNSLAHLDFEGPTPLEQDAAQMHEMFKSLIKVGFEERQALQLIAFLMAEAADEGGVNLFFDESFFKEMNKEEDDGKDS
jgi:hypothetical protein